MKSNINLFEAKLFNDIRYITSLMEIDEISKAKENCVEASISVNDDIKSYLDKIEIRLNKIKDINRIAEDANIIEYFKQEIGYSGDKIPEDFIKDLEKIAASIESESASNALDILEYTESDAAEIIREESFGRKNRVKKIKKIIKESKIRKNAFISGPLLWLIFGPAANAPTERLSVTETSAEEIAENKFEEGGPLKFIAYNECIDAGLLTEKRCNRLFGTIVDDTGVRQTNLERGALKYAYNQILLLNGKDFKRWRYYVQADFEIRRLIKVIGGTRGFTWSEFPDLGLVEFDRDETKQYIMHLLKKSGRAGLYNSVYDNLQILSYRDSKEFYNTFQKQQAERELRENLIEMTKVISQQIKKEPADFNFIDDPLLQQGENAVRYLNMADTAFINLSMYTAYMAYAPGVTTLNVDPNTKESKEYQKYKSFGGVLTREQFEEYKADQTWYKELVHLTLDILGLVGDAFFGAGAPFDLLNALLYISDGAFFLALLSLASVFGADIIAKGVKYTGILAGKGKAGLLAIAKSDAAIEAFYLLFYKTGLIRKIIRGISSPKVVEFMIKSYGTGPTAKYVQKMQAFLSELKILDDAIQSYLSKKSDDQIIKFWGGQPENAKLVPYDDTFINAQGKIVDRDGNLSNQYWRDLEKDFKYGFDEYGQYNERGSYGRYINRKKIREGERKLEQDLKRYVDRGPSVADDIAESSERLGGVQKSLGGFGGRVGKYYDDGEDIYVSFYRIETFVKSEYAQKSMYKEFMTNPSWRRISQNTAIKYGGKIVNMIFTGLAVYYIIILLQLASEHLMLKEEYSSLKDAIEKGKIDVGSIKRDLNIPDNQVVTISTLYNYIQDLNTKSLTMMSDELSSMDKISGIETIARSSYNMYLEKYEQEILEHLNNINLESVESSILEDVLKENDAPSSSTSESLKSEFKEAKTDWMKDYIYNFTFDSEGDFSEKLNDLSIFSSINELDDLLKSSGNSSLENISRTIIMTKVAQRINKNNHDAQMNRIKMLHETVIGSLFALGLIKFFSNNYNVLMGVYYIMNATSSAKAKRWITKTRLANPTKRISGPQQQVVGGHKIEGRFPMGMTGYALSRGKIESILSFFGRNSIKLSFFAIIFGSKATRLAAQEGIPGIARGSADFENEMEVINSKRKDLCEFINKLSNIIYSLNLTYDRRSLYSKKMSTSMLDNLVEQAVELNLDSANIEMMLREYEENTSQPQEDEEQETIELFTPKPNIEE